MPRMGVESNNPSGFAASDDAASWRPAQPPKVSPTVTVSRATRTKIKGR